MSAICETKGERDECDKQGTRKCEYFHIQPNGKSFLFALMFTLMRGGEAWNLSLGKLMETMTTQVFLAQPLSRDGVMLGEIEK